MKKRLWISFLLVPLLSTAGFLIFSYYVNQSFQPGFSLTILKDNTVLISDADVLSYNWTSQEMVLSEAASQKIMSRGESLYNFAEEFSVRIDDQEIYRGIFRSPTMSALPAPPKIAIMYPSIVLPSASQNIHAIRLFYPGFQAPEDRAESNVELSQHFAETGRLSY